MADTRDRLIELFRGFVVDYGAAAIYFTEGEAEILADHLLAKGFTLPEWISVKERLPTIDDATEQGAVLAWEVSVKHWDIWAWDCVRDYADRFIGWMPLPQPPRGLREKALREKEK